MVGVSNVKSVDKSKKNELQWVNFHSWRQDLRVLFSASKLSVGDRNGIQPIWNLLHLSSKVLISNKFSVKNSIRMWVTAGSCHCAKVS